VSIFFRPMIHTLFIFNPVGEIIMEKHWRGTLPRSVGEDFWANVVMKAPTFADVVPVVPTARYYLIHIQRGLLFFLAVLHGETPPMMTLELLDRIATLFEDYFHQLNEEVIKDNFVTCYQLLEEMIDNGFPIITEPSVLKDLVPPPTLLNKLKSVAQAPLTSSKEPAYSNEMSPVPWRKPNIKYTNNEIFFDIIEEIDCIIDGGGQLVSGDISGRIDANSRLSGFPDVLLSFINPQVLEDVAFHPCVRFARYEQDRSLSFVPPDGSFELMRYRSPYQGTVPFYVTPKVSFHRDGGRLSIVVGLKMGRDTPEKGVQDVKCSVVMPQNVDSVRLEPSQGTYMYDNMTKELKWDVGRVTNQKVPSLTGSIHATAGTELGDCAGLSVLVDFKIPMIALSGLRIDTVTLTNERYKPYKGVRPMTKAGVFQVRTG